MQIRNIQLGGASQFNDEKVDRLLFVSDEVASISPPVKQLKRFSKISLKSGETKQVSFTLRKEDLMFVNHQNKWIFEPGYFKIAIGSETKHVYLY